jgi:hypothetical protein
MEDVNVLFDFEPGQICLALLHFRELVFHHTYYSYSTSRNKPKLYLKHPRQMVDN